MTEPWEQIENIIQRFEQDDLVYEEMKKVPVDDDRSVDLLLAEFRAEKWRTTLACVQALRRSTVRQTEIVHEAGIPFLWQFARAVQELHKRWRSSIDALWASLTPSWYPVGRACAREELELNGRPYLAPCRVVPWVQV